MVSFKVNKDFLSIYRNIKDNFGIQVGPIIKEAITDFLSKGISPVEGKGRFVKYSSSYTSAILNGRYVKFGKAVRPVNLKLTGKLHNSIKIRPTASGLTIWFSDKKAEYHQNGTSKMPQRKLLPDDGELFSQAINEKIEDKIAEMVDIAFR